MTTVNPNHPIHPKFHERISAKVEGQLPAFVKEDHQLFVDFMEAYYEYMEQEGKPYEIIGSLDNYANVDKTVDDFLQYFKKQFGEDIPEAVFANANKPFVLKHLRDFYRTKGSEKSFQFLFRLLYKQEITFYFPREDILRVSDGKYSKDKIIRVLDNTVNDGVYELIGKRITGQLSGATAIVESITKENIGQFTVSTMFLSEVLGTFWQNEIISDGVSSFRSGNMIIDTTITNPGTSYSVGDAIPITSNAGSGGFIRIAEVYTGSLKEVVITSGGTGYKVGDKLTIDNTNKLATDGRTASLVVSEVDTSGTIIQLNIENSGRGYTGLPVVSGGSGTNAVIAFTLTNSNIGGVKSLNIISNGFGYLTAPTLDFTNLGDSTATGTTTIGGYSSKGGEKFINNDGFLSSDKHLQDSFYYQLFSYVITSGESINRWREIVKRVAHPAGLALFGNFQLVSNISLPLSIVNVVQRDRYTIIFHDGTIEPALIPVGRILDLRLETCDDEQDQRKDITGDDYGFIELAPNVEDYRFITESVALEPNPNEDYQTATLGEAVTTEENSGLIIEPAGIPIPASTGFVGDGSFPFTTGIPSPTNFGSITDNNISGDFPLQREDYNLVTQETFYILPTKCQTYEQDLGVQKLSTLGGYDDYLFTITNPTRNEDDGLVTDLTDNETDDFGWVFQDPNGVTQLRLGPLRRTIDRQKFNSQGGFSQALDTVKGVGKIIVTNGGSGYTSAPTVTIVNAVAPTLIVASTNESLIPGETITGQDSGATGTVVLGASGTTTVTYVSVSGTFIVENIVGSESGFTKAVSSITSTDLDNGSGTLATAVISDGVITDITIINAGLGYISAPLLTLSGGGSGASIKTIIDGTGSVTGVDILSGGSGYTNPVNVTISAAPAGGTDATANTTSVDGVVTSITIDDIGSGYEYHPTVTITGGGGSNATATAVRQITTGNPIENFSEREIVEFVLFAGLKTKKVVDSMVVQYNSGTESTSLPFTQIG